MIGRRRILKVLATLCLTVVAGSARAELLPVGSVAPDFTLTTLDGRPATLSEHRGRPVVLEFWASWCGPCRRQAPRLRELAARFGDRVAFLMVNTAETAPVVRRFVDTFHLPGTVLLDPDDRVGELYGTRVLPSLFVVDGAGRIQAAEAGSVGDLGALLTRLAPPPARTGTPVAAAPLGGPADPAE